jgi:hypothetical protein
MQSGCGGGGCCACATAEMKKTASAAIDDVGRMRVMRREVGKVDADFITIRL